ncbi:hypothetical protein D3C81_384570 [compost metagenome]
MEISQQKVEKVIEVLNKNGYNKVEFLDLEFLFNSTGQDKYSRLSFYRGEFVISTKSSDWDTSEVNEFIAQLKRHNELAKQLNEILK